MHTAAVLLGAAVSLLVCAQTDVTVTRRDDELVVRVTSPAGVSSHLEIFRAPLFDPEQQLMTLDLRGPAELRVPLGATDDGRVVLTWGAGKTARRLERNVQARQPYRVMVVGDVFPTPDRLAGALEPPAESPEVVPGVPTTPTDDDTDPLGEADPFEDVVAVGTADAWLCSGVVVADRWVLTAAHCEAATRVLVGPTTAAPRVTRQVVRRVPHPTLDVQLLALEAPLDVERHPRGEEMPLEPRGPVALVGFGVRVARERSTFGTRAWARFWGGDWSCTPGRARATRCRPSSELVVSDVAGSDTCAGDSGGGLFEWNGARWLLRGITSRSVGGSSCGRGGIYVRADVLRRFIDDVVGAP